MRTAHLPTVHASVAIRRQYWEGGGPMNKFEQISSHGHQMSLAGDGGGPTSEGGGLYTPVKTLPTSLAGGKIFLS